jgi:hypothetical protein
MVFRHPVLAIAVNRTLIAGAFFLSEGAPVQAALCVMQQISTLVAQRAAAAMVRSAMDADHGRNRPFFASDASSGFRRVGFRHGRDEFEWPDCRTRDRH